MGNNKLAITFFFFFYCIIILLLALAVVVVVGSREINSNNGNGAKKISNSDYFLAAAIITSTTSRSILIGQVCRRSICKANYISNPDRFCTKTLSCGKCIDYFCDDKPVNNEPSNIDDSIAGVDDQNDFNIDDPSDFETGVVDNQSNFETSVVDDQNDFNTDDPSYFETGVVDDPSNFETGVVDDQTDFDTSVAGSSNTIIDAIMNDYFDCDIEPCFETNTIEGDKCFKLHPSCGRCEAANDGEQGRCTFAFNG